MEHKMNGKRRRGNRMAALAWVAGLLLALSPAAAQAQCGGWEWQNPLPRGNWLRGVWGSSGTDVFAVGGAGTILHYCASPHTVYLPLVLKSYAP
jgi:hypothetical protein